MTQFARPDSTTAAGSWSASSSTLHGDTSDQSDATYISTTSSGTVKLGLPDVTDPASSADHTVRIRARASGSGGPERLNAYLVEGTTIRAQVLSDQRIRRDTAFTELSYTLVAFEADSITDYTNLEIWLAPVPLSGGDQIDVAEVVLEVPDNTSSLTVADLSTGPTVDAVVLTGTHILTVADGAVTATIDAVVLDQQGSPLTIADMSVTTDVTPRILADTDGEQLTDTEGELLTDDPLELAQILGPGGGNIAGISDWSVTTTVDNVDLTQTHNITVADARAAATIDGDLDVVVVFEISQFDGGGMDVAATIDSFALTQTHNITVADASAAAVVDSLIAKTSTPPGGQGPELGETLQGVADMSAGTTIDAAYAAPHLTVADARTIGRMYDLDIEKLAQLVISDASATVTADNIDIEQYFTAVIGLTLYARSLTHTLDTRPLTLTIDTRTGG